MTLSDLSPVANHLWQSTFFAVAAWLLTLALRKNRASVRYWVWFAASAKFLVPFSLLVSVGSKFAWKSSPTITQPQFTNVVNQLSQPFTTFTEVSTAPAAPHASSALPFILLATWLCGVAVVLIFWLQSLRQVRAIKRGATPLPLSLPIPAMSSSARMEPGVFGIFNPVLILPEGITDRLTPAQLNAVIAHELCHVQRKDNLTAAIHMLVETIFWFHPFVWWIQSRLVAERERSCDEAVVNAANDPQIYAEAILNVCKLYIESPLQCMSGVTGSNLKKRIRTIISGRVGINLTFARIAAMAILAVAAITMPVVLGLAHAAPSPIQLQNQDAVAFPPEFKYEVVSVKPSSPNSRMGMRQTPDGFVANSVPLMLLFRSAYHPTNRDQMSYRPDQMLGAPDWVKSERFDIDAKMDSAVADKLQKLRPDESRLVRAHMLQLLLEDRFRLTIRSETRELPIYSLVVVKSGKLHPASADCTPLGSFAPVPAPAQGKMPAADDMRAPCGIVLARPGHLTGTKVTMSQLAANLSGELYSGRAVLDKTGLAGEFDVSLDWTPDPSQLSTFTGNTAAASGGGGYSMPAPPDPEGPGLFTVIQQQLGLKLESAKGPVEVLVIDHIEKPSGN